MTTNLNVYLSKLRVSYGSPSCTGAKLYYLLDGRGIIGATRLFVARIT
jgi:hypothetical protein